MAVTIKMITVNLPLGTPNVTERESQRGKSFPDRLYTYRKQNVRDRDGTENSPIQPIAGRQEQKQDGHHC